MSLSQSKRNILQGHGAHARATPAIRRLQGKRGGEGVLTVFFLDFLTPVLPCGRGGITILPECQMVAGWNRMMSTVDHSGLDTTGQGLRGSMQEGLLHHSSQFTCRGSKRRP